MRYFFFIFICFLGGVFFFVFTPSVSAASSDIFLSEVSIAGATTTDEFVELYNQGDTPIDIGGLQLRRRTSSGTESSLKVFAKNSIITPHSYFLFTNSDSIFRIPFADSESGSSALAPDNSIGLFTKSGADGVLLDSLAWGKGSPFVPETPVFPNPEKQTSLTRTLTTLSWSQGTITPTNSKGMTWITPAPDPIPEPARPPLPGVNAIRFNEIFPNPSAKGDQGEFIELYNFGGTTQDISGWSIHDATKTGKYLFPAGTLIPVDTYLVITDQEFTLSLNNTDEVLSLLDTAGAVIDTMGYEKTKEDVSLNFTASGWRGGRPTPGKINEPNNLPETREKVPKKGYRGVPVDFDARGKDSDGQGLKYTWDFGDNHKSYKEKTSHTYEENGTYSVVLVTTDGSDDMTELFTLKIETPPRPNIHITAMTPNPSGNDSGAEWIMIENRGKKSIDLKGFSIATGWKKLSNHPIRKSFVIAPKSQMKLTRESSLFTLPNQKGKIELRAPDGKVLQKIKYKLEKSIKENAVYRKEKGKRWEWQESAVPKDLPPEATSDEKTSPELPITEPIPLVPENLPTEAPPAPTIAPETEPLPMEDFNDKQVLGAETTIDEAAATITETPSFQKPESFFDFFKNFFATFNAQLNAWQNKNID